MTDQTEPAISVHGVTKTFRIPLDGYTGIKQRITGILRHKKGYREFKPLNGISFEIEKGDFFGIVGRNGSGKSTLLKTIAGIYNPDRGSVKVNGLLVPFIELGVGFNPELSGRENVYLNAALLGFSRKETTTMYDEIVDFAELHDFMEERLKNYSSGMQVRLAFSIAIRAKGDILLLDEVLAVGDEAFQRKCFEYFAELKQKQTTVILVTHSMEHVQRFCNKALLISEGKVVLNGSPIEVAAEYGRLNRPTAVNHENVADSQSEFNGSLSVTINNSKIVKSDTVVIDGSQKTINVKASIKSHADLEDMFFGITIRRPKGELIFWSTTEHLQDFSVMKSDINYTIQYEIQNILGEGDYILGLFLKRKDRTIEYVSEEMFADLKVVDRGEHGWRLHPDFTVKVDQL
jgi:ABC-2 type transport system ATP-binding protein